MKAFLVACLLSAVCLANAARSLRTRGNARAGLGARLYAGAESRGPSGAPGVTYSLGGNANGQLGGQLGTGLDGASFGPWPGQGGAGLFPGYGWNGYGWNGHGWNGHGGSGNYGWGYPSYGIAGSPWGGAYGSNYYPYGGYGYGYNAYPQAFGRNYFSGNFGGSPSWNFRSAPGPVAGRSGPASFAAPVAAGVGEAAGVSEAAGVASAPPSASASAPAAASSA